ATSSVGRRGGGIGRSICILRRPIRLEVSWEAVAEYANRSATGQCRKHCRALVERTCSSDTPGSPFVTSLCGFRSIHNAARYLHCAVLRLHARAPSRRGMLPSAVNSTPPNSPLPLFPTVCRSCSRPFAVHAPSPRL
ncbi:unnamed protein product, partial [Phaeothamnion confervicola]